MTSTFKKGLIDYAATPQRLEKAGIGTMLKAILAAIDQTRGGAHLVPAAADASGLTAVTSTTSEADMRTFCDALREKYETHRAQTSPVHWAADSTNTMTADNPANFGECLTLLNELKGDFNAHILLATSHYQAENVNTITAADATVASAAGLYALANACLAAYDAHVLRTCLLDKDTCAALSNIGREGV